MTRFLCIIITLALFISCKQDEVLDEKLKEVVDIYIAKYPLKVVPKKIFENEVSYPSYHIYFDIEKKDTIMNVFLSSSFNNVLRKIKSTEDEEIMSSIKSDGFILYKIKYPLNFFNLKYYKNNNLAIFNINKKIPDSLKIKNFDLIHSKAKRWKFKVNNGCFEKIE